ncbi:hypothetical protein BDZ91DRAFT_710704 [Kalaharituber pfeilii]|nr:hypothetical protein BDZ91DRAFT_710704 [Kalaharituber pfeilii]
MAQSIVHARAFTKLPLLLVVCNLLISPTVAASCPRATNTTETQTPKPTCPPYVEFCTGIGAVDSCTFCCYGWVTAAEPCAPKLTETGQHEGCFGGKGKVWTCFYPRERV